MSGASAGLSILFFAIEASIVTSIMATAVEIPIKQIIAELIGNPIVTATIAAETVPSIPTIMKSKQGFISEVSSCYVPVRNLESYPFSALSHLSCKQRRHTEIGKMHGHHTVERTEVREGDATQYGYRIREC
jgi:hypothetical protein